MNLASRTLKYGKKGRINVAQSSFKYGFFAEFVCLCGQMEEDLNSTQHFKTIIESPIISHLMTRYMKTPLKGHYRCEENGVIIPSGEYKTEIPVPQCPIAEANFFSMFNDGFISLYRYYYHLIIHLHQPLP